ncbi:MAG: MoaD/ThiS family protein [Anaerolineae bacterium]|nr:MoaD/ThiS family protein [Anaerolineae bacterium]
MTIKFFHRKTIYTLDKEMSLKQAYKELGLIPESYLAVRNNEMITESEQLKHGDEIKLVPVISGGSI